MVDVRYELVKEISGDVKELRKHIMDLKVDVAALKVKASIWGIIGGGISTGTLILIELLTRK